MPALFVTFEGPEGCGKTTQVRLLAEWLSARGYDVLATREPGGTRIGEQIRAILLNPDHTEMVPAAEILLFSAARAQIVHEVIIPHLQRGGIVLCDRFADSTLAYQGYGHGLDLEVLRVITAFATAGLTPDVTFYLDIPVEEGLRRKAEAGLAEWNRLDQRELAYHQRVQEGYRRLIAAEPARWVIIDARGSIEAVHRQVVREMERRLAVRQGAAR
jgi:dTMP kinase